jgi:hypothetical protein
MEKQNTTIDWEALITRGIESDELDYKAAQNWSKLSRSGKAKFVRHALALANTKGGYIVVGVGEDATGRPARFTGLTATQLKSFDPTDVGNFVNSHVDPAIDFDIERPKVNGKSYVVFVIRRFADVPHVCSRATDKELQVGAFYIRTADASSRAACRASEMHGLIQRALRNQREVLGRMLRGILYENSQYMPKDSDAAKHFEAELASSQRFFRPLNKMPKTSLRMELHAYPENYAQKRFTLTDIRTAVEASSVTLVDRPLVEIGDEQQTYTTNTSVRCVMRERHLTWQAFRSSLFHLNEPIPITDEAVSGSHIEQNAAEAMSFLSGFYADLGMQSELINMVFTLHDTRDMALRLSDRQATCRIPLIEVTLQRSAADLAAAVPGHAARLVREVFDRFNVHTSHAELEKRLTALVERK